MDALPTWFLGPRLLPEFSGFKMISRVSCGIRVELISWLRPLPIWTRAEAVTSKSLVLERIKVVVLSCDGSHQTLSS
jgi:hypothetical protein